eukprot:jgi/Mesvir1/27957/Mv20165-RA.1
MATLSAACRVTAPLSACHSSALSQDSQSRLGFASFNGLRAEKTQCSALARMVPSRQSKSNTLVIEAVKKTRQDRRETRHNRIRRKVSGTEERPRLAVFRSNQHIYAQVIDDTRGVTLAAASTNSKEMKATLPSTATKEAAMKVGEVIAKKCQELNITKVAFDRGGYLYHGRVQAVADSARAAGLSF